MPSEGPGQRYSVTATKITGHGKCAVELGHAGIAAKSAQILPAAPSVANAAAAVAIAIGEEFVIMLTGVHTIAATDLPAGAAAGDPLYIKAADNTLHKAVDALTAGVLNAGFWKFGLIDSIDTTAGRAEVNLNLRSSF